MGVAVVAVAEGREKMPAGNRAQSWIVAWVVASCIAGQGARAESASDEAETSSGLEEIVVTARKQKENLQDVPLAVSAVTSKQIEEEGLRSMQDLALTTTGFVFKPDENGRNSDRPVIRGQGNLEHVPPDASFFIDGVAVDQFVASAELSNLDRVEIIRGPQAAVFGRATYSGAINLVTKKPTNDDETFASLDVATKDQVNAVLSHSGPLIPDKLFYYLSGRYYYYGGSYKNVDTGDTVGQEQTGAVTGALRFTPNEGLEMNAWFHYQQDRDGLPEVGLLGAAYNNCYINDYLLPNGSVNPAPQHPNSTGYYCGVINPKDVVVAYHTADFALDGLPLGQQMRRVQGTYRLAWDLGFASLDANTGYSDYARQNDLDSSFTQGPVPYGGYFNEWQQEENKSVSQEIRLSSERDSAIPLHWSFGLYYYRNNDNYYNDGAALAPADGGLFVYPYGDVITTNRAVFGSVEYRFAPLWTLSIEGRYQTETPHLLGDAAAGIPALAARFDAFLPRGILSFRPTDGILLYALGAQGNKPGGFNSGFAQTGFTPPSAALAAPLVTYKEEKAWTAEIGLKTTWFDKRVTADIDVYHISITGQQLNNSIALDLIDRSEPLAVDYIQNIPRSSVTGVELEVHARPSDLLDLGLSYAFSNCRIGSFYNFNEYTLTSTIPGVAFNPNADGSVAGNECPRAPQHVASLTADLHKHVTENWSGFTNIDYSFQSSEFPNVENLTETGNFNNVNLHVGVRSERFSASLFATNLTNNDTPYSSREYVDASAPDIPISVQTGPLFARGFIVALRRPRQLGINLTAHF